ncbi:MAG: hypothetical protein ACI84K_001692 [Pseudohongiellaceae bacterium]|jgi:hypothetical protein
MKYWVKGVSVLLLLFSTSIVVAGSKNPGKVIAGWVEKISFSDNDLVVKVKLDTGAKTSSIFAKDIKKYKRDGEKWVDFTLVLQDKDEKIHKIPMSAPRARRVRIKNHDGNHDRRIVVEIPFCFDGRSHISEFTLADRSEYIYPVLLGRAFLKEVAVVDPNATFLTKATCKPPEKLKPKPFEKTSGKINE